MNRQPSGAAAGALRQSRGHARPAVRRGRPARDERHRDPRRPSDRGGQLPDRGARRRLVRGGPPQVSGSGGPPLWDGRLVPGRDPGRRVGAGGPSAVAAEPDGGFVVTWIAAKPDRDPNFNDPYILARRFDVRGARVGGADRGAGTAPFRNHRPPRDGERRGGRRPGPLAGNDRNGTAGGRDLRPPPGRRRRSANRCPETGGRHRPVAAARDGPRRRLRGRLAAARRPVRPSGSTPQATASRWWRATPAATSWSSERCPGRSSASGTARGSAI
jgi:hypothetical protein